MKVFTSDAPVWGMEIEGSFESAPDLLESLFIFKTVLYNNLWRNLVVAVGPAVMQGCC